MLELRKRHKDGCKHFAPGRPFSEKLDCKKCPYFAYGSVAGEKVRNSLDTWNYEEARALLVAQEAEIKNPSPKTEPLSVGEAVTRFTNELTASNRAHRTVLRYRYSLERLTEFLSSVGVDQIAKVNADHLAAWKNTWNKQTDVGRKKEQERLRTFFRWTAKRKYTSENPAEQLMAIQVRRSSKRERFTEDQIARIYEAVDELHPPGAQAGGYATNAHVRAFLMVLQYAALRIGDVCALRRSDITGDRLTAGRIQVQTGKTGTFVSAVLPPSVLQALDQLPHQGDRFFMPDQANLTVRKNKWGEMLGKVYNAARVPYRSHAWRDTLVFRLLQNGVGIDLVAMLLGHTDIRITMRHYAAWVPERQTSLDAALRSVW